EICTLKVAPQPVFKSIDSSGQYSWESWIRSAVISYSVLWKDSLENSWKSEKQTFYPSTDQASIFTVKVPDSLLPLASGTWNYALFTEAGETKSLKTGSFDVP
ncbi:MAG: hypothetical protein Q4F84_06410, partial [Fibrobacter sp.]|nr:hypothetical protein [Fibrobacter sp.]